MIMYCYVVSAKELGTSFVPIAILPCSMMSHTHIFSFALVVSLVLNDTWCSGKCLVVWYSGRCSKETDDIGSWPCLSPLYA